MPKLPSRFRPYRRLALDLLLVAGVAIAVVVAVWLLNRRLIDAIAVERFGVAVDVVQPLVTAVVVIAGAVFAYRKLQLFRDFEPHLTVTQTASHRPVGTQYVHIAVTATLHNSSKVRVEIRESFFRLHQIQPLDDEDIEALYEAAFNSGQHADIGWPVIDEAFRRLGPNELVIEPGESHHEYGEFIVSNDVDTVLIYSYFYNLEYSQHSRSAQGWNATTVHDMVTTGRGDSAIAGGNYADRK